MSDQIEDFIIRWRGRGGSERANFQTFARDLTALLGVEEPKVATSDDQNDDYRFLNAHNKLNKVRRYPNADFIHPHLH